MFRSRRSSANYNHSSATSTQSPPKRRVTIFQPKPEMTSMQACPICCSTAQDIQQQQATSSNNITNNHANDDNISVYSAGCAHYACANCYDHMILQSLECNALGVLTHTLSCPLNPKCKGMVNDNVMKIVMSPQTKQLCQALVHTIPKSMTATSLHDFDYYFDSEGVLRSKITNDKFHFISQRHYDALGVAVEQFIQQKMKADYNMIELCLPLDASFQPTNLTTATANIPQNSTFNSTSTICSGIPSAAAVPTPQQTSRPPDNNNIFVSDDFFVNQHRCMVLLQGSGVVRAGQWARSVCLNENLQLGSVFPFLNRAKQLGFSTIVLNPNLNIYHESNRRNGDHGSRRQSKSDSHCDQNNDDDAAAAGARQQALQYYLSSDKRPLSPQGKKCKIEGSETPADHTIYVWDHLMRRCPAKEIVMVSHSAGGVCTMALLKYRMQEVLPRLSAIAFTDSVHSVSSKDPAPVKQFLKQKCAHFVASDQPVGTPLIPAPLTAMEKSFGMTRDIVPQFSAGHTKHEYTTGCAFPAVFNFFEERLGLKQVNNRHTQVSQSSPSTPVIQRATRSNINSSSNSSPPLR